VDAGRSEQAVAARRTAGVHLPLVAVVFHVAVVVVFVIHVPAVHPGLDHAAGQTATGVAGRLGLAIVLALVEDDGLADHRVGVIRVEADQIRGLVEVAAAVLADLDVAQVAGVSRRVGRTGVLDALGVEVTARGGEVRGAAVAGLVDVEPVQTRTVDPLDVGLDGHRTALAELGEGDGAGDGAAFAAVELGDGGEGFGLCRLGGRRLGGLFLRRLGLTTAGYGQGERDDGQHQQRFEVFDLTHDNSPPR
jgi:hypothetical protein